MARDPDLLVIGGGPAGLAAAIRGCQAGLTVRVIDFAETPIDKACGEGIMPDGVALLERLGVAILEERRRDFRGIRYVAGEVVAEGTFPSRPGWGVRRLELHRALADRARTVGVDLCWGVAARGLEAGGVRTNHGLARARWLVAADGLRSPLRRAAGLEGTLVRPERFGVRRHFRVEPWTDRVEVYWGEGSEAYVTPVGGDTVGIAILFEGRRGRFEDLQDAFPELAQRLGGAPSTSQERGAGPLGRKAKRVVRGNLALIGDAAGYLDAITGEGMALAFHEAFAVVEAIRAEDLGQYARTYRRIVRLPQATIRLLLAAKRRPWLRHRLFRALRADPGLFDALLAFHTRERSPLDSLVRIVPRLARRLVVPQRAAGGQGREG